MTSGAFSCLILGHLKFLFTPPPQTPKRPPLFRDKLGDLPDARALAARLEAAPEVTAASLGRRLRGRAFAPDLAVYLAKEGTQNGSQSEGSQSTKGGGDACFRLVVRLGLDVQEVVVQSQQGREAFKETLAAAVAAMTD